MDATTTRETLGFQAEVKQLLHLMVHSLYGNKEIFLRELVSNASDAADKLRFEALADGALFENDPDLKILVDYDIAAHTITITDNGIGMSRQEVIDHIGTIDAAKFDGAEDRKVVLRAGTPRERTFAGGEAYLYEYGIPQFFFHVATAYNILRHNGIELGKADYMGER